MNLSPLNDRIEQSYVTWIVLLAIVVVGVIALMEGWLP